MCPTSWHVPADAEWTTLTTYLGGESGAGGKLKETGTTHWAAPNAGATNETGFTALPGGYRYVNGTFFLNYGIFGYWWSSSESTSSFANSGHMSSSGTNVFNLGHAKPYGLSVRCLRD